MSYTITIKNLENKFFNDDGDSWQNLTQDLIYHNDEVLESVYKDSGYIDEFYNELEEEEKTEYIRESDAFYQIEESFKPSFEYVHILQHEATSEQVLKIYKNAPGIIIIEDDNNNYYIGLSSGGTDLSEELAYAYMIIDRCIPPGFRIDEENNDSLSKEAHKELIEFIKLNKGNK